MILVFVAQKTRETPLFSRRCTKLCSLSLKTLRILVDGLFPIFHQLTPQDWRLPPHGQNAKQCLANVCSYSLFAILSWAFHSFGNTQLYLIRQKFINSLSKSPAWPFKVAVGMLSIHDISLKIDLNNELVVDTLTSSPKKLFRI